MKNGDGSGGTSTERHTGTHENPSGDLVSGAIPRISFEGGFEAATKQLTDWAESSAVSVLEWYLSEKKRKARASRGLRAFSVLFIAFGSLVPLVAVGMNDKNLAIWGYPILGLGASAVGLDKAFGFSSSWMRYLVTANAVRALITQFQLECMEHSASLASGEEPRTVFYSVLSEVKLFMSKIESSVGDETVAWITEFHSHVAQLEASALKG